MITKEKFANVKRIHLILVFFFFNLNLFCAFRFGIKRYYRMTTNKKKTQNNKSYYFNSCRRITRTQIVMIQNNIKEYIENREVKQVVGNLCIFERLALLIKHILLNLNEKWKNENLVILCSNLHHIWNRCDNTHFYYVSLINRRSETESSKWFDLI